MDLSVILTGGLMVYISMKMLTLTNLLLDQFELGFLAGINMILFAYLVLIYTLRGAEQ